MIPSRIFIVTLISWTAPAFGAGSFIVDPSANVEFSPSISTSSNNNIPFIHITAPTAAGISHNKFEKFDVGTEGVIHNNSLTGAHTSVLDGGTLIANPNFTNLTASTIIDEVTSANTSTLDGAIEVYGDAAGVIIANPNGISCNGCSFINAPNSALTTGIVSYGDAGNISIDTSLNTSSVTIGEGGLNAAGYGSTSVGSKNSNISLIARKILLGGSSDSKVWNSDRVDLITGSVDYDFSKGSGSETNPLRHVTEKTPAASISGYQIDVSAISEVNVGKINIVATEDGLGVRMAGQMNANSSNVEISSDGELSVMSGGQVYAMRDVSMTTNESANVVNKGSILAARNTTINSSGSFGNDGGTVRARRSIAIDAAGDVENSSSGQLIAMAVDVKAGLDVKNSGSAEIHGTYQSGLFTATSGAQSRDAVAVGLADAIRQIDGLTATVSGNEIIVSMETGLSADFDFNVVTTESDGTASDGQLISVSGTGDTRYVKIMGAPEDTDIFEFRMFGHVGLTAASDIVNGSYVYSYGNQFVNASANSGAGYAARLSYKFNGDAVAAYSEQSKDWAGLVSVGTPRFEHIGSYARGAASSGAYFKPDSASVTKANLSSVYVSNELAEKVIDKDAVIFASDPFVVAKAAETDALVTTAQGVTVEDRDKEFASRALVERSNAAETQLAAVDNPITAVNPLTNLQSMPDAIRVNEAQLSNGQLGQIIVSTNIEVIEISEDGQVEVTSEASGEAESDED